MLCWNSKIHLTASSLFFLLINTRSELFELGSGDPLYHKIQENFMRLIYHWVEWSNFNIFHIFQWFTFTIKSFRVLHPLCASLLHLLTMRSTVSSLTPLSIDVLFCCVLSIFVLTELVFMTLFCATISRDSISYFIFFFRWYVQIFSCAISLVCRLKYPYSYLSALFCFLSFDAFLFVLILPKLLLATVINLYFLFLI